MYINSYIFISLYILLITILYVIYVCLLGGNRKNSAMCVQVVCQWLPQRLKSTFLQLFNYITATALHFKKKSRKILAFDAKHCKFHKLHCFHIFQCFFDNALNKVLVGYIIQKRSSSNQQQNHQSVSLSVNRFTCCQSSSGDIWLLK